MNFSVLSEKNVLVNLADFAGRYLVIYFYPKDMTPGCTQESQDFRNLYTSFQGLNTDILGVSRDSVASHIKFKEKENLPYSLLADTDETMCKAFDVLKVKKNYGREYIGVDRSTFVFDTNGALIKEWRTVKVKEHAATVLQTIKDHQQKDIE